VVLPPAVLGRLNRSMSRREADHFPSFGHRLGELQLGQPDNFNLGQWLPNAQSWLGTVPFDFESLADAAVDELLDVEAKLRAAIARGDEGTVELEEAPQPAQFPLQYTTLEPGRERERQRTLGWWDRFQLADGVVPGVARAAVASAMIGGMAALGQLAVSHSVYVYNGLGRPVSVTIGTTSTTIHGGGFAKVSIGSEDRLRVRTVTDSGQLVEEFDGDVSNGQSTYVYNVARAALLYNLTLTYGLDREYYESINREVRPEILGNPRWTTDRSWHRFSEPEKRVTLSRGERSTRRTLLRATASDVDPRTVLASARDDEERASLIRAHVQFDPPGTALFRWAEDAERLVPELGQIFARRVAEAGPSAIEFLRAEYDVAQPSTRAAVCARHRQWAASHPGAAGAYVTARCMEDAVSQENAMHAVYDGYPTDPVRPYAAHALAFFEAERGAFDRAATLCEAAVASPSVAERAGVLAGRLARVQWALARLDRGEGPPSELASAPVGRFAGLSPALRRFLDAENGVGEYADQPTYSLAHGQLSRASNRATGASRPYFDALVGASDGATPSMISAAVASTSTDGFSPFWIAALALREGRPIPSGAREHATRAAPQFDAMVRWLGEQRSLSAETSRAVPAGFSQPLTMAMATVVLGRATPVRWRTIARAFFFAIERPYLNSRPPLTTTSDGRENGGLLMGGGLGASSMFGEATRGELGTIESRGSSRSQRSARPSR
jgi:hypothetical protein